MNKAIPRPTPHKHPIEIITSSGVKVVIGRSDYQREYIAKSADIKKSEQALAKTPSSDILRDERTATITTEAR